MTRLVKTKENINGLPIGFQEVEYLQSAGAQWIDTGVYPTQLTEVEYRCAVTGSVSNVDSHLFGSRLSASSEAFDLAYMNTTPNGIEKFRFIHGTTTTQETTTSVTASQLANPHTYYMSGTSFKVDGSEKMSFTTTSFTGTYSLWLFGVNSAGSLHNQVRAQRVYKCKIWDNNTLVRDFIPCLDNSGKPCMYDLVGKKPYYNLGTGEFTYGRQIIPVEYLETTSQASTSTTKPWINTLVNYWADFEIGVKLRESASNVCLSCGGGSYRFERINATNPYWRFQGGGSGYNYDSAIPITEYHVLKWKDGKISCDGEVLVERDHLLNSGTDTALFTNSTASGNTIYPNVVYFLKMWNPSDGTLVRDYLPAIDENGVAFMFDRVTHTIFDNAGTGTFSYGSPIYTTKTRLIKDGYTKDRLPIGFKRVEYLQSSGTQYIDTGYKYTSGKTQSFNGNIMWTDKNATANFFYGYRSVNSATYQGDMRAFFIYGSTATPIGRLAIRYGVNTDNSTSVAVSLNTKCNISFDGSNLKVNGTTYATLTQAYTPANYNNMWLFWCNCTGYYSADVGKFIGRIYNWQMFEDGILVRDYIPCLDNNNVPCMYDKVEDKAYYNKGTGTFSYGREIHPVEYLESTGTQYINTRYIPNINTECYMNLAFVSLDSTYRTPFSVRTADGATNSFTIMSVNSQQSNNSFAFGSTYWSGSSVPSVVLNKTVKAVLRKGYASWNGVSGNAGTSITPTSLTAYMFGRNANGTASNFFIGRIYDCQLKENNTLVRDYIPAIDENGVGFMFDKVTNSIYDNAGSGVFTTGNIILSAKTRLVPSWLEDYTFVNYIESTGTQYINTGVTLTNNHSVEIDYQLTQASQSRAGLFGNLNMTGSNQGRFGSLLSPSNQQLEHGYGTGNDYWQQGLPNTNRHKLYQKKNEIYFDGTLIHTFTSATFTLNTTAPLGSFGYTNYTPAKAKYYNSKWWNGDTLIRNFIPAIRKSDSAVGMLDIVNRVFYTNQGTGVFSYG